MRFPTVLGPHQTQTIYVGLVGISLQSWSICPKWEEFLFSIFLRWFCMCRANIGILYSSNTTVVLKSRIHISSLSSCHPWVNTVWAQWYSYLSYVSCPQLHWTSNLFWRLSEHYSKDCLFFLYISHDNCIDRQLFL